jgi:hypothetical protein
VSWCIQDPLSQSREDRYGRCNSDPVAGGGGTASGLEERRADRGSQLGKRSGQSRCTLVVLNGGLLARSVGTEP